MDNPKNIFKELPDATLAEQEEVLLEAGNIRIARIVSGGQAGEIYDQAEDEWVIVLSGEAKISFPEEDGHTVKLEAGDYLYLKAGQKHQVTKTSNPCLWLCVYFTSSENR
mgnify:CR=1 FL=1